MRIDQHRLQRDLEELGQIGYVEGRGVTRLALTEEDLQGRQWLIAKMQEAGMQVRVDAAANVIGRLPAPGEGAQVLAIGSHLDTVPQGGRFDGALGVLAGLECARVLNENGVSLPWDLEVINFTDEEGHHYAGTFGSRAMVGERLTEEMRGQKVEGVPTLTEDLNRVGLDPGRIGEARRDPGEIRAYLELHVEQGNRMESGGIDLAPVTGIVGIYRYVVTVFGMANHAGTTPMASRSDALVAAAPVFHLLPEWTRARTEGMVATIGQVTVEPGAVNIIPSQCRFSVELRSLQSDNMGRVRDRLIEWLDEHVEADVQTVYEKDGVELDADLIEIISNAGCAEGLNTVPLASGAGHDAQTFAPVVPTGMIFVPSRGGLSHCPEEYSEPEWVANGAQVLLRTVLELAAKDA